MNKKDSPTNRNNNGVSPTIRSRTDSATYILLAVLALLGAFGIDLGPWFDAKINISIEHAQAESKMKLMILESELKQKQPNNATIEFESRLTELEKFSHQPGEK